MKHLKKYNETRFIAKPGLKGGMDVATYKEVSSDIKDILLDLTDQHYNFRTLLNSTENPTSEFTGKKFSVEIYNQTEEGMLGWYMGRFKWEDVSDYVYRIYDYMVHDKWIGTWTPVVGGVCAYYTGEYDDEMEMDEYKFFSAAWGRFTHTMENYHNDKELRSIKIEFTLGR